METYRVGVIGDLGRKVIHIPAKTRREATSKAWAMGYTVVDCEYHPQDSGYPKNIKP